MFFEKIQNELHVQIFVRICAFEKVWWREDYIYSIFRFGKKQLDLIGG